MRRRHLLLLVLGIVGLLATGYAALWLTRPVRITWKSCHSIRRGMTKDEILRIVGLPPGDYRSRPQVQGTWHTYDGPIDFNSQLFSNHGPGFIPEDPGYVPAYVRRWIDDDGELQLFFDNDDGPLTASMYWSHGPEGPFLDRLRRWLGL